MRHLALLLILLCATMAAPTFAQENPIPENTGINMHPKEGEPGYMSKEDMEAEAAYIYQICEQNMYQKKFYNCECVSGAYLIQREKLGPFPPRDMIMKIILESEKFSCIDAPGVAANTYYNCMRSASVFRETATDNDEYCTCMGNVVAKQYQKKAIMDPAYFQGVRTYASSVCSDPAQRPTKKAAAPPDPMGLKIPN